MVGSIIKNIKTTKCGWDGRLLGQGNSTTRGHSHKELMKCLYRSNVELFRADQVIKEQDRYIKELQQELGKYVIEEQEKKEKTGLMDVKNDSIIDAPPLNIGKDVAKNDQQLAKELLEAESVIDNGNPK